MASRSLWPRGLHITGSFPSLISGRCGTRADADYRFNVSAAAAAGSGYLSDVTGRLNSTGAVRQVKEERERSCDVCVGPGKRDEVIVFSTILFTRLCT